MTSITWRSTGAAVVAGLALLAGACAPTPEIVDAPAPAPPAAKAPTTTAAPTPTTTVLGSTPQQSFAARSTEASIGGCQVFPPDHFLNATNIDKLPVHPRSQAWTAFLGRDGAKLHPPSSTIWDGARGGMPINIVDSRTTPKVSVFLDHSYARQYYTGGFPIPAEPRLEGWPSAQWDKHLIMLDVADCSVYELIQYDHILGRLGIHRALSAAHYRLDTTDSPPSTTNAAVTPMVGQYIMADEATAGRIAHVVGFCTTDLGSGHVWPARSSDGVHPSPDAPPMGTWLRLRSNVDTSKFTGQARAIVEALKRHGTVLTDTCGHQFKLMDENSDQWNHAEMKQLESLKPQHFEAVDASPMRVSANSFRVN